MKDAYCIDLERKTLEVELYPLQAIKNDLLVFGFNKLKDLEDPTWRIFETDDQATDWLDKYQKTLKGLDNKKICNSRDLPAILYKRKFIVQTLLGDKLQTVRKYKKPWQKGQLFNLHDQTYFLTVKLKSIKDLPDGLYQYNFELP